MRIGLVGHTGFVGSNLLRQLRERNVAVTCFNRSNIQEIADHEFDKLYVSAIHAAKWWANANAAEDLGAIDALFARLRTARVHSAVFISTVDVYDPPDRGDETTSINLDIHPYGRNRYFAEELAKSIFGRLLICRLQGLIGNNLKKNLLFDLKHDNRIELINLDSSLQWYPISRLLTDIDTAEAHGIGLVNLSAEPIVTRDIATLCDLADEQRARLGSRPGGVVRYDIKTRHHALFGGAEGYVVPAAESRLHIERYFNERESV